MKMWRILFIAGMFLIGVAFARSPSPPSPPAVRNVAIVIGNADYAERALPGAQHDAGDVSAALLSLGFDVTQLTNVDADAMQHAIDSFIDRLGPRDNALLYFAGHGFQAGGDAMLLPIDVHENAPLQLMTKGVAVQDLIARLAHGRPLANNIVVLDTCLNDPFGKTPPRTLNLPQRTLVAFAASPDTFASESEHNGVFTAAILRQLRGQRHLSPAFFDAAALDVARQSHGGQQPWIASTLRNEVSSGRHVSIMQMTAADETPVRTRGILPKDSNEQYELTFWDSIKDSTYPSDYEAYLKAYPNGRFAALAKARIDRLRASATAKPAAPPPGKPASPAVTADKPRQDAAASAAVATKPATNANTTVKAAASEIKDCPACPLLIAIMPGSFTMGSNNDDPAEKPPHHVTIARPFAIGKYEVTVEQWNACADAGACTRIAPDSSAAAPVANSPMRNVSWDDAQVYVKWLSKVGGKPYRLPTEAEWEYATRGGTQSTYWWGEQMKKGTADCKDCGEPYRADAPTPAGSFAANPFGLYDTNGSVWEWVADCWHSSYKNAPADGRAWDDPSCSVRVIRGGSWREGAAYMQSATRFKYSASVRQSQNGFRVARDAQ
jgi:formylglycine-generating enzyme required for sulfatase activity